MASMKSDTATSDLIAVMALIAVFVTATAIAGVTLLSYPPGDAAPAVIVRNVTGEGGSLSLSHDGGDPLVRGHFKILVDGVDHTKNFSLIDASPGVQSSNPDWTTWETGQVLVLAPGADVIISNKPHIQVVGEGVSRTGSDWLLHEIGTAKPTETTGPTPTVTVTPTTTTTVTPTPVTLVANFTVNVTSGIAPLTVAFTDTSTGEPTSWSWDFGDGSTSDKQSPTHTYTTPGTYTVTLTVTGAGAPDIETKTNYIVVISSSTTWQDTLLNTADGKPGTLMPGGYLEFGVTGAYSKVTIGGTQHDLEIGDTVRLVIGTSGKGKIYISESQVSMFAYDDVTLFINGDESGTGKINEDGGIWISNYEDLASTLTLNVPPVNAWTEFTVAGTPIINRVDDNRQITLDNLMPGKDGLMNLNNHPEEEKKEVYFIGSITGYTLM